MMTVFLSAQNVEPVMSLSMFKCFLHLVISVLMCGFHVSLLSDIMPKHLACLTYSSSLPLSVSFGNFLMSVAPCVK